MKVQAIAFSICVAILMTGCVSNYHSQNQVPPSQTTRNNTVVAVNSAISRLNLCTDNLRETKPAFAGDTRDFSSSKSVLIVDNEVLYYKEDDPIKITLLSSKAKLTQAQRTALFEYIQANQKCRNIIKTELANYPSLLISFENFYSATDMIYAKLISQEWTIGEANRQRAMLVTKAKTEFTNASSSMDASFNAQINTEIQAAQQQQIINQQRLKMQQDIWKNALSPVVPAPTQPVQTNCSRIGNSINCTTY
jgi:hypothetical protein